MKNTIYLLAVTILVIYSCTDKIEVCNQLTLLNSSFEISLPERDSILASWIDENDLASTPDIFYTNDTTNNWGVTASARTGDRYIGLVTRANGTAEGISQKLDSPIEDVVSISFEVWVSRSEVFNNPYTIFEVLRSYTTPVRALVYVLDENGEQHEIYKSDIIENKKWTLIKGRGDYCGAIHAIGIKALHEGSEKYNGHILLDDVSIEYCKVQN